MAFFALLVSIVALVAVFVGTKGILALSLIGWAISPILDGKKLQKSRVTAAAICGATTALLWWKVGWVLALLVGLFILVGATVQGYEADEKKALRGLAASLFED